jgi:uncharacterized protein
MDWTPYIAGVGIGVLSWVAFLLSNKPLGCSTAYTRTSGMIERIFRGKRRTKNPTTRHLLLLLTGNGCWSQEWFWERLLHR